MVNKQGSSSVEFNTLLASQRL